MKSTPVNNEAYIMESCNGKRVLDMGCVRHSAEFAISDPAWFHERIRSAAKYVIGVDYLLLEVNKLQQYALHTL